MTRARGSAAAEHERGVRAGGGAAAAHVGEVLLQRGERVLARRLARHDKADEREHREAGGGVRGGGVGGGAGRVHWGGGLREGVVGG